MDMINGSLWHTVSAHIQLFQSTGCANFEWTFKMHKTPTFETNVKREFIFKKKQVLEPRPKTYKMLAFLKHRQENCCELASYREWYIWKNIYSIHS